MEGFCLTLHFLLVCFRVVFYWGSLFYFIFTSLHANLEEFSCKLSNSFPEMHANFVKFFQDTSQKIYRLCSFKKEFAKWIDRHSVLQLCSGNIACKLHDFPCLHLVINLLITKGLFYHTFHIHLSASLSYIIRSNYGIFKLEKLWVCVCVCVCVYVLSHVRLFAVLWNAACPAPLFMGFPGQEYWSGLPFRLSNS